MTNLLDAVEDIGLKICDFHHLIPRRFGDQSPLRAFDVIERLVAEVGVV
jgi:hypothetical protein